MSRFFYDLGKQAGAALGRHVFSLDEAEALGAEIGIDWKTAKFSVEQFRRGLHIEQEHAVDPQTDVLGNSKQKLGKVAWAHLKELADYYDRLEKMEEA